ncbi:MAG: DNA-directed RNA polymerase subunit omega [Pseudomonadota bacterium]
MARVTVEDCLHVANRFELVVLAAQRAKQIASGSELTLVRDNDKDSVVSLREIAGETVDLDKLREDIVQSYRKRQNIENFTRQRDKHSDEIDELLAEEGENVEDDIEEHLSIATHTKSSDLSFESDNVTAED